MIRLVAPLVVVALVAAACEREAPKAAPAPAPQAAESGPRNAGGAPRVSATVVRDGAGVLVVLDVALRDAGGRAIDPRSVRVAGLPSSVTASPPEVSATAVAIQLHADGPIDAVDVEGAFEDGARWTSRVDTRLGG